MGTKHMFVRTQTALVIGIIGLLASSARSQLRQPPSPVRFLKTRSSIVEKPSGNTKRSATELLGKLPISFEPNVGQTGSDVRFLAHSGAYTLYLMQGEAVLKLSSNTKQERPFGGPALHRWRHRGGVGAAQSSMFRMKFEGANLAGNIVGLQPLPGKINYFTGNNPNNWHTDVPTFASVNYEEIYPGIDLRFYGDSRRLEYDFNVKPGADPGQIALRIQGAMKVRVDDAGDLQVSMPGGDVELHKPGVYQREGNTSKQIAGNYVLGRDRITFHIGDYDHSKPLTIDPAVFYSTYLGGSSYDYVTGIAVDSVGNAYVTGITWSLDFPTTSSALNPGPPPSNTTNTGAAFVTEINHDGTSLIYSSYLTGNNGAYGSSIALDSVSPPNVYVIGGTCSTDFPTTPNAYLPTFTPSTCANYAVTTFVTKLNPTVSGANGLVYSTYLGGNGVDYGDYIAVDSEGNIYVSGMTSSSNFPTTSTAFQTSNKWGGAVGSISGGDAFVSRIDPNRSGTASLVYSTYLGGSGNTTSSYGDEGLGIAVDSAANVYVSGYTDSLNFPTTSSAYSQSAPGSVVSGGYAGFLTRIDTNGSGASSLFYSTYVGGSTGSATAGDYFWAVALGPGNLAYVTGSADSLDFPVTPGSFRSSPPSSGQSVIFCIVDTTQTGSNSLSYSTFLSGNTGSSHHYNWGASLVVDAAGSAYITGTIDTTDFPVTTGAFQTSFKNTHGGANSFVSQIMPLGNGSADLVYSTYYGGSGAAANYGGDWGYSIALDSEDNVYIGGFTESTDFPITTGAFQTTVKGPYDSFVAKLMLPATSAGSAQVGGQRPVVAPSAVELGFTETSNGNLHLEIPLGSFPQRGAAQSLGYSLVYDSFMWIVNPGTNRWQPGGTGQFGQWWSWRLGSQDSNNPPHWSIQTQDPACGNVPEYLGFFGRTTAEVHTFFQLRPTLVQLTHFPAATHLLWMRLVTTCMLQTSLTQLFTPRTGHLLLKLHLDPIVEVHTSTGRIRTGTICQATIRGRFSTTRLAVKLQSQRSAKKL